MLWSLVILTLATLAIINTIIFGLTQDRQALLVAFVDILAVMFIAFITD